MPVWETALPAGWEFYPPTFRVNALRCAPILRTRLRLGMDASGMRRMGGLGQQGRGYKLPDGERR